MSPSYPGLLGKVTLFIWLSHLCLEVLNVIFTINVTIPTYPSRGGQKLNFNMLANKNYLNIATLQRYLTIKFAISSALSPVIWLYLGIWVAFGKNNLCFLFTPLEASSGTLRFIAISLGCLMEPSPKIVINLPK